MAKRRDVRLRRSPRRRNPATLAAELRLAHELHSWRADRPRVTLRMLSALGSLALLHSVAWLPLILGLLLIFAMIGACLRALLRRIHVDRRALLMRRSAVWPRHWRARLHGCPRAPECLPPRARAFTRSRNASFDCNNSIGESFNLPRRVSMNQVFKLLTLGAVCAVASMSSFARCRNPLRRTTG